MGKAEEGAAEVFGQGVAEHGAVYLGLLAAVHVLDGEGVAG
jgi:hypothetical protein